MTDVPEDVIKLAQRTAERLGVSTGKNARAIAAAIMVDRDTRAKAAPVGWETEAEWELEQRAFNWNPAWEYEDTRKLINDLWEQYCLAADPMGGDRLGHYSNDVGKLKRLLSERDKFIVDAGKWQEFVDSLGGERI